MAEDAEGGKDVGVATFVELEAAKERQDRFAGDNAQDDVGAAGRFYWDGDALGIDEQQALAAAPLRWRRVDDLERLRREERQQFACSQRVGHLFGEAATQDSNGGDGVLSGASQRLGSDGLLLVDAAYLDTARRLAAGTFYPALSQKAIVGLFT